MIRPRAYYVYLLRPQPRRNGDKLSGMKVFTIFIEVRFQSQERIFIGPNIGRKKEKILEMAWSMSKDFVAVRQRLS